jgi:hypothetical protein
VLTESRDQLSSNQVKAYDLQLQLFPFTHRHYPESLFSLQNFREDVTSLTNSLISFQLKQECLTEANLLRASLGESAVNLEELTPELITAAINGWNLKVEANGDGELWIITNFVRCCYSSLDHSDIFTNSDKLRGVVNFLKQFNAVTSDNFKKWINKESEFIAESISIIKSFEHRLDLET